MNPPTKAFVSAPKSSLDSHAGVTWTAWVHKNPKDFEMDSCGATSGFMRDGTEVSIIRCWDVDLKIVGVRKNHRVLKVRGNDENGRRITGWVLAHCVEIGDSARKKRLTFSGKK